MKVILLFFLFVIIFILGIIFSKVKIKLQTTQNLTENSKDKFNFKIIIYIFLFYKVKLIKFTIDSKKRKNKKSNKKQFKYDKDIIEILKDSKLRLEQLWLEVNLDTQSILITTFLTVIISTIVSSLLTFNIKSINYKKCNYKINPLYQNKNLINFRLDCMIVGDFVHISTIAYKLFKKVRNDKYGRTSNRRAYGYSNE